MYLISSQHFLLTNIMQLCAHILYNLGVMNRNWALTSSILLRCHQTYSVLPVCYRYKFSLCKHFDLCLGEHIQNVYHETCELVELLSSLFLKISEIQFNFLNTSSFGHTRFIPNSDNIKGPGLVFLSHAWPKNQLYFDSIIPRVLHWILNTGVLYTEFHVSSFFSTVEMMYP